MSVSNEASISPALLQAISQTLTSKESRKSSSQSKMDTQLKVKQELSDSHTAENDAVMNEESSPIYDGGGDSVNVLLNNISGTDSSILQTSQEESDQGSSQDNPTITPEDIKNLLKWKLNKTVESPSVLDTGKGDGVEASEQDMRMVNVLTSLAMQHVKSSIIPSTVTETVQNGIEQQVVDNAAISNGQQVVVNYNNSDNTPASPSQDGVVVSEGATVVIDNNGQRYYIQNQEVAEGIMGQRSISYGDGRELVIADMPQQVEERSGMDLTLPSRTLVTIHGDSTPKEKSGGAGPCPMCGDPTKCCPCPVCGDNVSGYHYGIFTCESCKGFFKRTVQNQKSFSCHKNGDCPILLSTRKKCPSCRFNKCIAVGMRTEAIRLDRTRGGRSSYEGCSPHGRPKSLNGSERKMPKARPVKRLSSNTSGEIVLPKNLQNVQVTLPSGEDISSSQLVAILNRSNRGLSSDVPFVPEVLTEIMNLESLLCDEESRNEFPAEKLSDMDPNMFASLLQLAEIKLYKLVRWARNLPQFSAIATDDQILLLQNAWADILALDCCQRSMQSSTEIFLPFGKSIDMERAREMGHNVDELVFRMLCITEHLRRLRMDQYEYVALKVLILITPDVKGMKEPSKTQQFQETIADALRQYTESHYPQIPNKYGELLLRLPELARVSMMAKDSLNQLVPPSFQSCGLLFELLKGDTVKDDQ